MQQMILNQNVKYILITRQNVLMKVSWFIFLKIEIKINFWNLDIDSSILSNSIDNVSEIEADENSFNYLNDMNINENEIDYNNNNNNNNNNNYMSEDNNDQYTENALTTKK